MTMRIHPAPGMSRQAGVSVIELLVGLTVGAIISVAALSSFSSTRSASATVSDSTRLYQDAALVFRKIGHHLRQTGAQQLNDVNGGRVEFNAAFSGYGTSLAPQALLGIDGNNNSPDVLQLSHDLEPTLNAMDCLGQAGSPATGIRNRFELVNGSLRCTGSGNAAGGPLIEGVEDFQVRYGVRTGDNLQYFDADPAWGTANWNSVETVMVCLILAGQVGGHSGLPTLGCDNQSIANDGRIRRTFVRVFSIRNIAL
jgi:type IV pilus assembly protein PilW